MCGRPQTASLCLSYSDSGRCQSLVVHSPHRERARKNVFRNILKGKGPSGPGFTPAKEQPKAARPQLTDEEFDVLNSQFDAASWNAEPDVDVSEPQHNYAQA